MFDSRYPHLVRLTDATDLPLDVRTKLVRIAREVESRVGCHSCWNKRTGQILFYLRDPSACYPGWLIRVNGDYDVPDAGRTDQWVNYLNQGKMPWEKKEAEMLAKKKEEEYRSEKAYDKKIDDMKPEVVSKIEHGQRKRRGVDKVIST